jgi:2-hydroxy-3-oxopropionate reductase
VQRLKATGATTESSAREVALASAVVLVVVGDTSDMTAVLEGDVGLLAGAHASLVVVDCGSHDPAAMPGFAAALGEHGAQFLDAPLSGGETGAIDGSLSIMVGGSDEALARALPVLEAVGRTIIHIGDVGTGQMAKACNQLVVAANLAALAESLTLAEAAGRIDPARLLAAMAGGLANSRVLELSGPRMVSGAYEPGGKARFHLRDLQTAKRLAASNGVELPVLDRVVELFERLIARGMGELDHSAVREVLGADRPTDREGGSQGG